MKYLVNAFSLNMVGAKARIEVYPLTLDEAKACLATDGHISAIGHVDTAAIVSEALGQKVEASRLTVSLQPGDELVVAQYVGPRLPEGATTLPEGARLEWRGVTVS